MNFDNLPTCPTCDGDGTETADITYTIPMEHRWEPVEATVSCATCHGRGNVEPACTECGDVLCDGDGRIPDDDPGQLLCASCWTVCVGAEVAA